MGAETAKPTRILYWLMDLSPLAGKCERPKRWWKFFDLRGRRRQVFAPHPPLVGRRRPDGAMATKAAAAYPAKMNEIIARAIVQAPRAVTLQRPQPAPDSGPSQPS